MQRQFTIATGVAALLAGTVWVAAQGTQPEAPGGTRTQNTAPTAQPSQKGESREQKNGSPKSAEPKGDSSQPKGSAQPKSEAGPKGAEPKSEQKAQSKSAEPKSEPKADQKAQPKAAEPKSDQKAAPRAAEPKGGEPKSQQGAGTQQGSTTTVTTEQRTRIRQTVIKESNAPRVTNVNFSLNVGTVVPRTVNVAVLPSSVVEIYPAWRSYKYFIVEERIVIVEPDSLRIVYIIDA
jgi:outer membrane biosynthesis protein TonB